MSIHRSAFERSCRGTSRLPDLVAGERLIEVERDASGLYDLQGPLHRDRPDPSDIYLVGSVQRRQHEQGRDDHRGYGARQQPLDHGAFTAVGEEEQVDEDHHRR